MKGILLSILAVLVFVGCGGKVEQKSQYNYISADETAKLIREDASKVVLVDIQEKEDFEEEHLQGALGTYAYPVKTDEDRAKLAAIMPQIKDDQTVVVVCPRGGGGADRAYDYLLQNGVAKEKLFTLTDGQYGWPRDQISDVLVQGEGQY